MENICHTNRWYLAKCYIPFDQFKSIILIINDKRIKKGIVETGSIKEGMTGMVLEKMKKATISSFEQGKYMKKISKECMK